MAERRISSQFGTSGSLKRLTLLTYACGRRWLFKRSLGTCVRVASDILPRGHPAASVPIDLPLSWHQLHQLVSGPYREHSALTSHA